MKIVTNGERPDLQGGAQATLRDGWPAFVLRGQVPKDYREDGLHLDPWIRTHQRLGATILAPAPRSRRPGTTSCPVRWTSPRSTANAPQGVHRETNLWVRHR